MVCKESTFSCCTLMCRECALPIYLDLLPNKDNRFRRGSTKERRLDRADLSLLSSSSSSSPDMATAAAAAAAVLSKTPGPIDLRKERRFMARSIVLNGSCAKTFLTSCANFKC
mmetsp:Transcript_14534/g.24688  ORF Transcript_14534/g.24688 Transcript_14534/m.24688 type:complete len:113 (+) Transcript_14534:115-453(+)